MNLHFFPYHPSISHVQHVISQDNKKNKKIGLCNKNTNWGEQLHQLPT